MVHLKSGRPHEHFLWERSGVFLSDTCLEFLENMPTKEPDISKANYLSRMVLFPSKSGHEHGIQNVASESMFVLKHIVDFVLIP